jgi:hypothetical protein
MVSIKKYLLSFILIWFVAGISQSFAQVDEQAETNSLFYYTGTLGSNDKIELNLQFNAHNVSGSYILVTTGDLFVFKGRLAIDKSGVGLLVYDESNIYVASIEAKVISEDVDFGREIKGVWKAANGKRSLNLTLKKIAELAKAENPTKTYFE